MGTLEAYVLNRKSGATWSSGSQLPQDEGSIVKVNILGLLLAKSASSSSPLTVDQRQLAEAMIEQSDNEAATSLWEEVGGTSGMARFDRMLGLARTTPSSCVDCPNFPWPGWGLTTTTAYDQVKLLDRLLFDGAVIPPAASRFERQLMESVVPPERWGVSGGVPGNITVALKSGWLPLAGYSDWQINSIGWVQGDGRDYLIALLSTHNPSETYGIATLNEVSTMIWRALDPGHSH